MRRNWLLALPLLMFTAACSGSSPVSPSASSGGATLTGSFVSATSGSLARVGRTAAVNATNGEGLTVSVVGTSLSALVRGGQFSLQGVPAGPLSLQFSGDGVDSELDLDPVQSTEDIDIEVGLDGSSIVLESERRSLGSEVQLEGRVESLPPTTADASFVVAGQLVTTTIDTKYFGKGTAFADLAIGVRVHVKGQPGASSLVASAIGIQNTKTDLPVNINGIIEAFSGDATAFQLTIDGRLIRGDAGTELYGGTVFADIIVGAFAVVKGLQEDGIVYARRLHVEADEEDENDASASIEGELMSIGGSGDLLTLVVGSTTVTTGPGTVVQRKGDKQPLATLVVGMTLHVVGTRQPDLSLVARKIQIKDDAAGGAFQVTGSMGSVKGTCPALSFSVNGYRVTTGLGTAFTPDCSTFKSGTKALVQGTVQADGSVIATVVTKQ
jgi:hypothetical protein